MRQTDDEPVVVAHADSELTGQMWRELLENNGIISMLRISVPLTGIANFASPHDLLVSPADADRARELLAAYDQDGDSLVSPYPD